MQEDAARQGLPLPDEESARERWLQGGVEAPDLASVKDFLRFYIATSRPQLTDKPTVDSINTVAEWFFAGFARITGTEIKAEERSDVYDWVRKVLTLEGLVVNKRRPKHNFAARDLTRILITLWTQDDLIFIPERYRIQFTFIIRVYYWTGARLSAFFTDGLRWRDVDLVLQRVPRGGWRLIYYIKQRWVKNNRDPENIVFGAAGKEHEKFVYNDAAFLLATAVADGALFGYKMLDDVRKQEIPAGEDELILRYKESALFSATAQSCPIDIDSTQHGYRSGTTPLEWRSEVPLLRETLSTDSFLDADNDGEDVFSQFIRSPSRSPSATGDHTNDVKAANIRKNANIAASTSSLSSWSGSSTKHNVHVKDQNSHQSGPRIRLRVGPPKKITLRFTRPKTKNGAQWSPKRVRKGAKRSLLVR